MERPPNSFDDFLSHLRSNMHNPAWLNRHEAEIYDQLFHEGMVPHRMGEVSEILRTIVPHFTLQPTHKPWLQLIENFLHISLEGGLTERLRHAHYFAGVQYAIEGNGQAAEESLWQAIEIAQNVNDQQSLLEGYLALLRANVYTEDTKKRHRHTYHYLKDQLESCVEPLLAGRINYVLGMYHLRHNQLDEALGYTLNAEQIEWDNLQEAQIKNRYNQFEIRKRMLQIAISLGIIHRHRGAYEECRVYIEGAEMLLQLHPTLYVYEAAFIAYELSALARERAAYEEALVQAKTALGYFEALGHHSYVAASRCMISLALAELGYYDKALSALEPALDFYQGHTDLVNVIEGLYIKAFIYKKAKNCKEAGTYLMKALHKAKDLRSIQKYADFAAYYEEAIKKDLKELEDMDCDE